MTIENKIMVTGVKEGGVNWETGIDIYTILHIKQITNEDSLYSTENSTENFIMSYMGKES